MLTLMKDLPENILGFYADGKIGLEDYENVLAPELERRRRSIGHLRTLLLLGSTFESFDIANFVTDSALEVQQALEKIAVVSDYHAIDANAPFFSLFEAGEVRMFNSGELESAKKWITDSIVNSETTEEGSTKKDESVQDACEAGEDSGKDLVQENEEGEDQVSQNHINTNFPLSGGNPG